MTTELKEMTSPQRQELTGAEPTHPGRVFTPSVDIFETDEAITVLADMPGVESDDLSIDLRDNTLTLNGTVREQERQGEHELTREYDTGSFYRQFRLSRAIDQGKIDASLNDGVLCLKLPKADSVRPRKIAVRTA